MADEGPLLPRGKPAKGDATGQTQLSPRLAPRPSPPGPLKALPSMTFTIFVFLSETPGGANEIYLTSHESPLAQTPELNRFPPYSHLKTAPMAEDHSHTSLAIVPATPASPTLTPHLEVTASLPCAPLR